MSNVNCVNIVCIIYFHILRIGQISPDDVSRSNILARLNISLLHTRVHLAQPAALMSSSSETTNITRNFPPPANFEMELQVGAEIKTWKRCSGRALLHILYEIVPSDNKSTGQVLVCLPGFGIARVCSRKCGFRCPYFYLRTEIS